MLKRLFDDAVANDEKAALGGVFEEGLRNTANGTY